jgi:arylsulfatase A-like enzyme
VLDAAPAERVRDHVLFTYDDHQAGTARQEAPGQPNRVRCVRDGRFKYAAYLDPAGRARSEHELYDMDADPLEVRNLVERDTARARTPLAERELRRLREVLVEECRRTGTAVVGLGG